MLVVAAAMLYVLSQFGPRVVSRIGTSFGADFLVNLLALAFLLAVTVVLVVFGFLLGWRLLLQVDARQGVPREFYWVRGRNAVVVGRDQSIRQLAHLNEGLLSAAKDPRLVVIGGRLFVMGTLELNASSDPGVKS